RSVGLECEHVTKGPYKTRQRPAINRARAIKVAIRPEEILVAQCGDRPSIRRYENDPPMSGIDSHRVRDDARSAEDTYQRYREALGAGEPVVVRRRLEPKQVILWNPPGVRLPLADD